MGALGGNLTYAVHPPANWTAGSVVATAGDPGDWAAALYGGHILSTSALAEMQTPVGADGSPTRGAGHRNRVEHGVPRRRAPHGPEGAAYELSVLRKAWREQGEKTREEPGLPRD